MNLKKIVVGDGIKDYSNILRVSAVLMLLLMIIDSKNIANHIFALVNIGIIAYTFRDNKEKYFYFSTLLFAIMSFTISIPLGKTLESEQIDIYYVYLFIYMVIFIFRFISSVFKNKKLFEKLNIEKIIFMLFIGWVIVSFFIADNKVIAFKKLILYSIMTSFAIMIINENKSKAEIKLTLKFLSILSIGIVFMGLIEIITGIHIQPKTSYIMADLDFDKLSFLNRVPTVFFYNPNNYGFVISLIMIGFIVKLFFSKGYKEISFNALIILLAQINLIFSRSRTSWITVVGAVVFIILFFIVTWEKKLIVKSILSLLLIMGIFVGLSYVPQLGPYYGKMRELDVVTESNNKHQGQSELSKEEEEKEKEKEKADSIELGGTGSVNVRVTLIVDVLNGVIKDKNYLGFGLGNTTEYYRSLNNTGGIVDSHNWWIEILGDFGIVGFALFFLLYVVLFFKNAIKFKSRLKENKLFYALGIVFLVSTAVLVFGPSSVYAFIPFWLINSLAIAITSFEVQ
ncbi:MAG: O-antigen ligase family protein [Clostridium sp.]|nr:O-antigen ligase family protein [Clostridium sp.]